LEQSRTPCGIAVLLDHDPLNQRFLRNRGWSCDWRPAFPDASTIPNMHTRALMVADAILSMRTSPAIFFSFAYIWINMGEYQKNGKRSKYNVWEGVTKLWIIWANMNSIKLFISL
jgi:hypothetical protein